MEIKEITAPFTDDVLKSLKSATLSIFPVYFCGRDAVLPKIVKMIEDRTLEDNGITCRARFFSYRGQHCGGRTHNQRKTGN